MLIAMLPCLLTATLADVVVQNPGARFENANWALAAALLVGAYLLGSIPSAVWISKRFFGQDIRTLGSKNAGSTNMYRVFGLKAGLPTQLIDIAKGSLAAALPYFAAGPLGMTPMIAYIGHGDAIQTNQPALPFFVLQLACGLMAVIGHVYTIFAGFKGGKGVNTMLGMMLVIAPLGSAVAVGTFVLLLLTFRMVSLGSMLAVIAFTGFEVFMFSMDGGVVHMILAGVGVLLSVFIIYTHRTNIGRIFNGTESKVPIYGKKK